MKSSKALSLYTSLDFLFGTTPELNIRSSSRYQTPCGSTLTLLVVAIAISVLVSSSSDLINKENPSVSLSEEILDEIGQFRLGASLDLNVALSLVNLQTFDSYVDPSVFTAAAVLLI